MKVIGTSLSFCIKDLTCRPPDYCTNVMVGRDEDDNPIFESVPVEHLEVEKIVSMVSVDDLDKHWMTIMKRYADIYWRANPQVAVGFATILMLHGMIEQSKKRGYLHFYEAPWAIDESLIQRVPK